MFSTKFSSTTDFVDTIIDGPTKFCRLGTLALSVFRVYFQEKGFVYRRIFISEYKEMQNKQYLTHLLSTLKERTRNHFRPSKVLVAWTKRNFSCNVANSSLLVLLIIKKHEQRPLFVTTNGRLSFINLRFSSEASQQHRDPSCPSSSSLVQHPRCRSTKRLSSPPSIFLRTIPKRSRAS